MTVFGKRMGGGRRSAARREGPLIAVLTTLKASHSAVLADISATGARLRAAQLPDMGEVLTLRIDAVEAFGAVIWVEAGECGIAFDRPLAPDEEQLLRQKVAETHGLPPDIKAAYDTWVLGCAR
jgi:hypothetical protein